MLAILLVKQYNVLVVRISKAGPKIWIKHLRNTVKIYQFFGCCCVTIFLPSVDHKEGIT